MSDREKIMMGLRCCTGDYCDCDECSYNTDVAYDVCIKELLYDTLTMMEEQEQKIKKLEHELGNVNFK